MPGHATIIQDQSGIAAAPDGRLWILSSNPADDLITVVSTFSYDGRNGFRDGPYGHWTGGRLIDTDSILPRQLAAAFWTAGVTVTIPGTGSAWSAGDAPQTAKSTDTNAVIAVYGPLP